MNKGFAGKLDKKYSLFLEPVVDEGFFREKFFKLTLHIKEKDQGINACGIICDLSRLYCANTCFFSQGVNFSSSHFGGFGHHFRSFLKIKNCKEISESI